MGNSNSRGYDLERRDSIDFDPIDMKLTKDKSNFVHYDSGSGSDRRPFDKKNIPRHTIVTQNKPISKDELDAQKLKKASPVLPEPKPKPAPVVEPVQPASVADLLDDFEIVEKEAYLKYCDISGLEDHISGFRGEFTIHVRDVKGAEINFDEIHTSNLRVTLEEINPTKKKEDRTVLSSSMRKPLTTSGPIQIHSVLEESQKMIDKPFLDCQAQNFIRVVKEGKSYRVFFSVPTVNTSYLIRVYYMYEEFPGSPWTVRARFPTYEGKSITKLLPLETQHIIVSQSSPNWHETLQKRLVCKDWNLLVVNGVTRLKLTDITTSIDCNIFARITITFFKLIWVDASNWYDPYQGVSRTASLKFFKSLADCRRVQYLNCAGSFVSLGSELTYLPPRVKKLRTLILTGIYLDDEAYKCIGNMHSLIILYCDRSGTGDSNLEHLKRLEHLEYLNLSETNVTETGALFLKDLVALQELVLWKISTLKKKETEPVTGVHYKNIFPNLRKLILFSQYYTWDKENDAIVVKEVTYSNNEFRLKFGAALSDVRIEWIQPTTVFIPSYYEQTTIIYNEKKSDADVDPYLL